MVASYPLQDRRPVRDFYVVQWTQNRGLCLLDRRSIPCPSSYRSFYLSSSNIQTSSFLSSDGKRSIVVFFLFILLSLTHLVLLLSFLPCPLGPPPSFRYKVKEVEDTVLLWSRLSSRKEPRSSGLSYTENDLRLTLSVGLQGSLSRN